MNRISLSAKFEQLEDCNSSFLRTKIKVFAFGKNRNNSNITPSAFESEKTKNSIYNIPVVAKFSEGTDKYGNEGDLEGHNSYLTTDKSGNLAIKQDTYPIGVVSSDANISFEEVNEGTPDNPNIKTYVVVDKVYLWKRYDAVEKIQEWLNQGISPKVSMEISNIDGNYSKESDCFMINSFEFEAIAALGSEIEPCFPMAQIETYTQQTFEDSFYQMIKELKFSLNNDISPSLEGDNINDSLEGGNKVHEQVNEILNKYNLTIEDLKQKEIDHTQFSLEDLEVKIQEVFFSSSEPENPEVSAVFSLTSNQLEAELYRELAGIETITEDYWGEIYSYPRYSYRDCKPDENIVVAYDCKNGYIVGFSYSVINDNVEIDEESCKRYKVDYVPMDLSGDNDGDSIPSMISAEQHQFAIQAHEKHMQSQFEVDKQSLQSQVVEAQAKFEAIEKEKQELETKFSAKLADERNEAESELFDRFAEKLTDEEMADVKANKDKFSLEEIEEKLLLAFAKKNLKFSANKQDKPLRYEIPSEDKPKSNKIYADLIEQNRI